MDTVTTTTPARQRLLDAVARLFYAEGMVATGIDTITAEAGVARKRLYNNFASKQDLMLAYIVPVRRGSGCWRCSTRISTTPRLHMHTGSGGVVC